MSVDDQAAALREIFTKSATQLDTALKQGLEAACIVVEDSAVAHAPEDTRLLKKSINHRVADTNNGADGEVGTSVGYAPFQEFGTSKMAAQPFLTPALNENKQNINAILTKALQKVTK